MAKAIVTFTDEDGQINVKVEFVGGLDRTSYAHATAAQVPRFLADLLANHDDDEEQGEPA